MQKLAEAPTTANRMMMTRQLDGMEKTWKDTLERTEAQKMDTKHMTTLSEGNTLTRFERTLDRVIRETLGPEAMGTRTTHKDNNREDEGEQGNQGLEEDARQYIEEAQDCHTKLVARIQILRALGARRIQRLRDNEPEGGTMLQDHSTHM